MASTNANISDTSVIDKQIESLKSAVKAMSELGSMLNKELDHAKETWHDIKYEYFRDMIHDILDKTLIPAVRFNATIRKLEELKKIIEVYLQ